MTAPAAGPSPAATPTPAELGVGLRISIHPHCDDYVEVILGALDDVTAGGLAEGLTIATDAVSTFVGAVAEPAEQRLADHIVALTAAAHHRSNGGHVVAHVLLSRGCPGEVTCDLATSGLRPAASIAAARTGVLAKAAWSLYPLTPGDAATIDVIEAAIERARARGTVAGSVHYATRLEGDLSEVVATAVEAWSTVGAHLSHVVTHLTLSVGSPTVEA